jgi:hypothetical protein
MKRRFFVSGALPRATAARTKGEKPLPKVNLSKIKLATADQIFILANSA